MPMYCISVDTDNFCPILPQGGPDSEQSITALDGPTYTSLPGPVFGPSAVINYTIGFNASVLAEKWVETAVYAPTLY